MLVTAGADVPACPELESVDCDGVDVVGVEESDGVDDAGSDEPEAVDPDDDKSVAPDEDSLGGTDGAVGIVELPKCDVAGSEVDPVELDDDPDEVLEPDELEVVVVDDDVGDCESAGFGDVEPVGDELVGGGLSEPDAGETDVSDGLGSCADTVGQDGADCDSAVNQVAPVLCCDLESPSFHQRSHRLETRFQKNLPESSESF